MTQMRDLEKSLRNILSAQLRELVKRCVPKGEWIHREQIGSMIDGMVNAWVNAEPEARPAILGLWVDRINSYAATVKTARRVKTGKSLAVSSRLPTHVLGKFVNPTGPKSAKLPFDLLEAKSSKTSAIRRQMMPRELRFCEVRSKELARLLDLNEKTVEVIKGKLRDSGLDFSFLNAKYYEASRKDSAKRAAGSKSTRTD